MNVLSEACETGLLIDATQAASGVAGILNGAKVRPYIVPVTPTPTTPLATFTASVDAGLAAQSITWGGSYRRAVGGLAKDGGESLFQLADVANATPIYGIVVTNSGGTVLLYAEAFANPVQLSDVLDALVYVPQVAFGGPDSGAGTIVG